MNIKDFAASRGKSKQRVYQMIKEAGLKVSDLTDGQGQITESGLVKLNEIVPDKVTAPEGESETEQSSGSAEKKEKKSELQSLLDTINTMSETIKDLNEQIKREQEISKQAQINLSQEQHLHADTKKQLHDLQLRLTAGSPEGESDSQPVQAEETELSSADPEQVIPQNEDKPDPEGENLEEKKQDPEKKEGETAPAAESSSPVTTDQKLDPKPEEKTKATLKQRLRFLFTGER